MTKYTIQGIPNVNKFFIFVFFAISLLLTSTYSYAQCLPDVMTNKTSKLSQSSQQHWSDVMTNKTAKLSQPSQQQEREVNEQKTDNIRVITTLINTPDQLKGKAKVTVTFNENDNNQVKFQSNNKTITAEEEIAFPLAIVKPVTNKGEEEPTMSICAVIEGFENTCDTVLLVENQTKPYRVNLELINFEELDPLK